MKQALDIDEQIQMLRSHGMLFDDEEKAKEILLDVGFYRFGFYSFPFERSYPSLTNRTHLLRSGKFQYTSIILLIINNIYRSQCTNSVLWEKLAASRSK